MSKKISLVLLCSVLFAFAGNAKAFNVDNDSAQILVRMLYQGLLMRQPDAPGLSNWSRMVTLNGPSQLPKVAGLIAGDQGREFYNTIKRVGSDALVDNMYLVFFNRSTLHDMQGRANWASALDRCGANLDCLRNTVSSFAGSAEFLSNNVSQVVNSGYSVNFTLYGALRAVENVGLHSRRREDLYRQCMEQATMSGEFTDDGKAQVQIVQANGAQMSSRGEAPVSLRDACQFVMSNAAIK